MLVNYNRNAGNISWFSRERRDGQGGGLSSCSSQSPYVQPVEAEILEHLEMLLCKLYIKYYKCIERATGLTGKDQQPETI